MSDSRYYQRRINQKLMFAREALQTDSLAAQEAAAWHLGIAYRAWLAEISTDPHHPLANAQGNTATALAESSSKHIPAALAECVQLEANPVSWLSQLLVSITHAEALTNKPPTVVRAGLIALQDVGDEMLNKDQLSECIVALDTLIERFRDAMQEC